MATNIMSPKAFLMASDSASSFDSASSCLFYATGRNKVTTSLRIFLKHSEGQYGLAYVCIFLVSILPGIRDHFLDYDTSLIRSNPIFSSVFIRNSQDGNIISESQSFTI